MNSKPLHIKLVDFLHPLFIVFARCTLYERKCMQTTNVDGSVDHPTGIGIGLKKTEFEFEIQNAIF